MRPAVRLALFSTLFVVLTGAGLWFAVARPGARPPDLAALRALPAGTVALVLLLVLGVHVADFFRYRAFARALDVRVPWRVGVDAVVANVFFSWLTPGAVMGAPAAVVMLGRGGVPWDAAALIAGAKSMVGAMVLVVAAAVVFGLGYGPSGLDPRVAAVVAWGAFVVAASLVALVTAGVVPDRSTRGVERVAALLHRRLPGPRATRAVTSTPDALVSAIGRLGRFRGGGFRRGAPLLLCHLPYFACFIGVTVVLGLGLGAAPVTTLIGAAVVHLAVLYLGPTPGGAGVAEATAVSFFGPVLGPDRALVLVLAARAVTLYLQIGGGFVYLVVVGGLRAVLARRGAPTPDVTATASASPGPSATAGTPPGPAPG